MRPWLVACCLVTMLGSVSLRAEDHVRELQLRAEESGQAAWGRWGADPSKYSSWGNHANRLIPVYSFGISLAEYKGANSPYRDANRLKEIYGFEPEDSVNPRAEYFDQTNLYDLQLNAIQAGKKHIILILFDGMDWQTTQAAAVVASGKVGYTSGAGPV